MDFIQLARTGLRILTSANGLLIRLYNGRSGGVLSVGEHGAEADAIKFYGPVWARSIEIQGHDSTKSVTLEVPPTCKGHKLQLPDTEGAPGEYLAYVGQGKLGAVKGPDIDSIYQQLTAIQHTMQILAETQRGKRILFAEADWVDGCLSITSEQHGLGELVLAQVFSMDGVSKNYSLWISPTGCIILRVEQPEDIFSGYALIKRL